MGLHFLGQLQKDLRCYVPQSCHAQKMDAWTCEGNPQPEAGASVTFMLNGESCVF